VEWKIETRAKHEESLKQLPNHRLEKDAAEERGASQPGFPWRTL
jgi:hypothetical protein